MAAKVEKATTTHLNAGNGILKLARTVGCGSRTVHSRRDAFFAHSVGETIPITFNADLCD